MLQNVSDKEMKVFLRPDHQIRITFQLSDESVITIHAVIVGIDHSFLNLESFGCSDTEFSEIPVGTPVVVLSSDTWSICRFNGMLARKSGRSITIHLREQRDVQQRRDYFRLDIHMPVIYVSPEDQQLSSIETAWKKRCMKHDFSIKPRTMPCNSWFKVVGWDAGPDVEPRLINLSGGGLEMKTPELFRYGHLIELTLFLPAPTFPVIFAVASVNRTVEACTPADCPKTYSTAMKFIYISEHDQQGIISYIFNDKEQ